MDEICEDEFCLIDNDSGEPITLTREEKERIFLGRPPFPPPNYIVVAPLTLSKYALTFHTFDFRPTDSLQSFYATGKSILPNEQFDRLKEDLSWKGSALVSIHK